MLGKFAKLSAASSKPVHAFAFATALLVLSACGIQTTTRSGTAKQSAPALDYGTTQTLTIGATTSTITPANTGGTPTYCAITSGTLPAGLTLQTNCTVTGSPTTPSAVTVVEISATNAYGRATPVTLSIQVNEAVPAITYLLPTFTLTLSTAMTPRTPLSTGGTITGCSVTSGALPTGLALSALCVVSGTPTLIAAAASVSITATNASGSSTAATLTITVNDTIPTLTYVGSPFTWNAGSPIATVAPSVSGGPATSCPVTSGTVPAGLALSADCTLTGTPTASVDSTGSVTFTPTNTGGPGPSKTLNYILVPVAPALAFSGAPYTWTVGTSVGTITPSNTGGAPSSCPVTGTLPTGISVSTACVISGTPTAIYSTASVTLTPTNGGGAGSAVMISITVNDAVPLISYSSSTYTWALGSTISPVTPTNLGGTITGCSVTTGALPAGLSIASDCAITGTTTTLTPLATIQITATNTGGSSAAASLSYIVGEVAPSISYSGSPYTALKIGTALSAQSPTNYGSTIASCAVTAGTLPAGLSLSSDCIISGTPTTAQTAASVTVTATNGAGTGSTTISFTIKGMYAYVANGDTDLISMYSVDPTTGMMTATVPATVASGSQPVGIVVNPKGTFAYAANQIDSTVSMYSIQPLTGVLTPLTTATIASGISPRSIAMDPLGKFLYVANGSEDSVTQYSIDATTGALTYGTTTSTSVNPNSIMIDALGRFLYAANDEISIDIFSYNATTGAIAAASPSSVATDANSTSIAVSDKFAYAVNNSTDLLSMYAINATTGELDATPTATIATGDYPTSVAVDALNRFVYVANRDDATISSYTISNSTTGFLTATSPTTVSTGLTPLAVGVDPSGRFAYAVNNVDATVSMFTIDQTTGILTPTGTVATDTGPNSIAISY